MAVIRAATMQKMHSEWATITCSGFQATLRPLKRCSTKEITAMINSR
jgi:hypothetical protein